MNVFIFLQYIVDHQFSKLFTMEVFFCNYEGIVWLGMVIWVDYYFIVYNVLPHALPSFRGSVEKSDVLWWVSVTWCFLLLLSLLSDLCTQFQWWCEWGGSFLVLSVDILNVFWMNLEDHFIPRLRKFSVLVLLIILFMSEVLPIVPWVISLTFYLNPRDLVCFVFINVQMFIFIYFIFCP